MPTRTAHLLEYTAYYALFLLVLLPFAIGMEAQEFWGW